MSEFVPTPRPEVPVDDPESAAAAAAPVDRTPERPESSLSTPARAWVLPGVILVVIGLTAAWTLLGLWPMLGGLVGLLMLIGMVSRWRQGARPNLSGIGLPKWGPSSSPRPATAAKPSPQSTRPPVPPRGKAPRPPAPPGPKPRPGGASPKAPRTRAAPSPDASRHDRPAGAPRTKKRPPKQPNKRTGKTAQSAPWQQAWTRWRAVGFWLASPIALPIAGLVQVLNWALRRAETLDAHREEVSPGEEPAEPEVLEDPPEPAQPTPVPGPKVDRPAAHRPPAPRPPSRTTTSGVCMSAQVHAAAEAIRDHIGGAVFSNMADFTAFVYSLDTLFEAVHESLGTVNARFTDDEPVDVSVVDHLEELRSMVLGPLDYARETGAVFRNAHERDLERLDDPRPGEEKMDYSNQ